ncbi:hypothetical protein G9U53_25415 [Rhodococcus sp. D-46]|uniref:hypothetical protein n=1 Tax=Rhodococcus TaxID=1827 RepID=UPI0007E55AE9|nr:hypothetical protein [Rhodococcus qingshengii]NHE67662.1 hypothetical protein [Rhodococcus sp. D-46]BCF86603.1 hypothetical protein RQCS_61480 [Rhodococcus qingshengii]
MNESEIIPTIAAIAAAVVPTVLSDGLEEHLQAANAASDPAGAAGVPLQPGQATLEQGAIDIRQRLDVGDGGGEEFAEAGQGLDVGGGGLYRLARD